MGLLILGIAGRGGVIQANVLSPMDMLVVGIIAIMLFGNRLPEVARVSRSARAGAGLHG